MKNQFVASSILGEFKLWDRLKKKRIPFSFDLEITARCNFNCRHCYINLPANDAMAKKKEMSLTQIGNIADQAAAMGSLWCLITGGEPLLRTDFQDIYLLLKKKGFLISVYTNASLITDKQVSFFKKYPPRELEITVYGVSQNTYTRVTRRPDSYTAFRRGLDLLIKGGLQVRLKAMALRSNLAELPAIASFCRQYTKDYVRFDPMLHLRYDGNAARNAEIKGERLSPAEIVTIEQSDDERAAALKMNCSDLIFQEHEHHDCQHLFHCSAGKESFVVSPEGCFHLCSALRHPQCVTDLKQVPLTDSWNNLVPRVRAITSSSSDFLENCRACPIINLCLWCPAHAHLETGRLDGWSEEFCRIAQARAKALKQSMQVDKRLDDVKSR